MNLLSHAPLGSRDLQASNIERHLVKSLHPIGEIAERLSSASADRVRLKRELETANGVPAGKTFDGIVPPPVDPAEATIAALVSPLDFPPLAAGLVPGDRVAIALDDAIPCVAEIVSGAVRSLESAGIERDSITIVTCDSIVNQICRDASIEESNGVTFVVHDPENTENLCPVGQTKRGEMLLINRAIFDADVVLPIGCARVNGRGAYQSLFPRFSGADAIGRYRTPTKIESPAELSSRLRETNEAGWLIGVPMVVEVVPGRGGSVACVVAGEPGAVARQSQRLTQERWSLESPRQVSLMIATVTGGQETQTWTSVGHALATAEHLVEDGGAVAICSNLREPPGRSLGRLIGNSDLAAAERKISHDHDADSWPAWQIARALQRGPVYFLSHLNPETVEDMGLAPVENLDELTRLAARHESFAVVEDAQHAVVRVGGANES